MSPGPCSPIFLFLLWGTQWGLITAESPITAQFGGDVTLSCLFPSKPSMNLERLTLTWQKEPERAGAEPRVVHSHYYGKDQLERQDAAYRNRTWLDAEGLARGNASLVLRGVRTQDDGVYHCRVASELGLTLMTRQVAVMAPYSEPHLTLDSFWRDHTLLTFSCAGGYPQASVEWRDSTGTNLTGLSSSTESVDAQGLYTVRSELAVPVGQSANLTVFLVTAPGQERPMQHITMATGNRQRCSWVWLLVAGLGATTLIAMTLTAVLAAGTLCPPSREMWGRCPGSCFTRTMDVEDPSPQSHPKPGTCPATPTTSLGADLLAAPSP